MKSVIYDPGADATADAARLLFLRAGDAIQTVEWSLARDPQVGQPLVPGGSLLMAVFAGAKSIGLPTIEVLYRDLPNSVIIEEMEFY